MGSCPVVCMKVMIQSIARLDLYHAHQNTIVSKDCVSFSALADWKVVLFACVCDLSGLSCT